MMQDILINQSFGFHIENGDMVVGNPNEQNKAILLKTRKGENKENLLVGVSIDGVLLGDNYLEYKHKIRQQLTDDGAKVNSIIVTNTKIAIDANY